MNAQSLACCQSLGFIVTATQTIKEIKITFNKFFPRMLKRMLTLATHRIHNLPVVVMMPHSRCNCRCVMCDIWKANHEKRELTEEVLAKHINAFTKLGVREVVFSGGEALMHSNLWKLCALLKEKGIKITLLSTGLLLQKNAAHVIENINEVIVSMDGSELIHDKIRNIPEGFKKLSEGIAAIKKIKKDYRITARCVLQRYNFFDFEHTVLAAKAIGLDQISFLAADVSTAAFNRQEQWNVERMSEVALNTEEAIEFERIIERSCDELKLYYDSRFIAESPKKIRRIAQYYLAINGKAEFPPVVCNAPWVSAVIESDGNVMPCFFHKPYGNIFNDDLLSILNSPAAVDFRKHLKIDTDAICKKCVCSLKLGVTQMN